MAATPKTCVALFRGASGRLYAYSLYNSDVSNAFVTWATTGTAGSGSVNFISAPENMQLVDISAVTGIADTTALLLWVDDAPVRNTYIAWANIVNTLQSRSFPPIAVAAGHKIQFAEV